MSQQKEKPKTIIKFEDEYWDDVPLRLISQVMNHHKNSNTIHKSNESNEKKQQSFDDCQKWKKDGWPQTTSPEFQQMLLKCGSHISWLKFPKIHKISVNNRVALNVAIINHLLKTLGLSDNVSDSLDFTIFNVEKMMAFKSRKWENVVFQNILILAAIFKVTQSKHNACLQLPKKVRQKQKQQSMNLYLKDQMLWDVDGDITYLNISEGLPKEIAECRSKFFIIFLRMHVIQKGVDNAPGHQNIIFIDFEKKIVERYEPHGEKEHDTIFKESQLDDVLEQWFSKMHPFFGLRYVGTQCGSVQGLQVLQFREARELKESTKFGFCAIWSLYFVHLRLLYPNDDFAPLQLLATDLLPLQASPMSLSQFIETYANMMLMIGAEMLRQIKRNENRDPADDLNFLFIKALFF
jgi:hypothetical protein